MTKTITAMFGIAVFAAILFGSAVLAPQAFAGSPEPPAPNEAGKVVICHNGDDGPETITVSGNAVQRHIDNHGDTRGECPDIEPDCSVSPEPLVMIFDLSQPQLATTSVGCINDQPIGLGASPVDTNCGDVGISVDLPVPTISFITLDAYGVDFEFLVEPLVFIPDGSLECSIFWETDSVINGVELHEQSLVILFPLPPLPP